MPLRRIAVVLGLAALAACRPSVGERSSPPNVDYAVFDPSSSRIPLPNDLALQTAATLPAGAQKEFLAQLVAAGGFPNDQEVPITIQFVRQPVGGTAAPLALDPASIKLVGTVAPGTATVGLMRVDLTTDHPAPTPVTTVESAYDATTGTLTIRNKPAASGSRAWPAGQKLAVFVRGGANGVKTADGGEVEPMPTFAILRSALANNLSLTDPVNEALLPGTASEKAAAGAQLEQIRLAYRPLVPLATAIGMPIEDDVSLQTFGIAPVSATNPTTVPVDQSAGLAPLPFDLLLDPATGKVANNPAFGAAAAGLATLDGFSTTAMILAPTSAAIDAGTVNATTVFLYKVAGGAATRVSDVAAALAASKPGDAVYVTQPPQIEVTCPAASGKCSSTIGLQPAVPAPIPQLSTTLYLPPLDEKTTYAVVITDGVKDATGKALGRSTFARIVLGIQSPVAVDGKSQLAGVPDSQATQIEDMRTALVPVLSALPTGVTKDRVAFAYTFKTQSISGTSLALSAAPFSVESGARSAIFTPDAAPTPVTAPAGVPTTNVAGFFDVQFKSVDAIDKSTGALRATLAADLASATVAPTLLTELHALVAVPDAAVVPACPSGGPFPAGAKCARLVVFGHGLNGSKETLFAVASSLASAGFVAAAIDFPLHGARNWCSGDADCGGGGTCNKGGAFAQSAGQGDCGTLDPASAQCQALRPGVCSGGTGAVSPVASRFFLSQNFFRMRDAFRQNLLDQSALALALSRPPAPVPQPSGNPFRAKLPAGVIVDPSEVYYEGVSLGSISGTSVLATSKRFTRGSLSVGGGTFIDIGIDSPTFQVQLAPLFTALLADVLNGATFDFAMVDPTSGSFNPVVAAQFLKLVNVAKWVMDPGDPINYARNLKQAPLPDLLANPDGSVKQSAKSVYGQIAVGDTVVPNPTNFELYSLIMGGLPGVTTTYDGAGASHSMLATQAQVQLDAVGFLVNPGTPPLTTRTLP